MTLSCPVCLHRFRADAAAAVVCPVCDAAVDVAALETRPAAVAMNVAPPKSPPQRRNLWARFGAALTVAFVALLLIAGGTAYALWDYVTDPEFVHHIDRDGGFTIDFPHRPFRARPVFWGGDGLGGIPVVGCERPWPNEYYLIAWHDLDEEDLQVGADTVLEAVVEASQTFNPYLDATLRREKFDYRGHPAIEVVTGTKFSAGKGILRAVIVGQRLFVLSVVGGWIQDDSARAKQFLNSLSFQ